MVRLIVYVYGVFVCGLWYGIVLGVVGCDLARCNGVQEFNSFSPLICVTLWYYPLTKVVSSDGLCPSFVFPGGGFNI